MLNGISKFRSLLRSSFGINQPIIEISSSSARWSSSEIAVARDTSHDNTVNISIPKRIHRKPDDLLVALKSTILTPHVNPLYVYHDDPHLIPRSNFEKRSFSLSRESGKKAAKWIRDQYKPAFQNDIAEPPIKRFMPSITIDKDSATVELLKQQIVAADVAGSAKVFDLLTAEGKSIDSDTKQSYLELQCFYNGKESTDDELLEEKWFRRMMEKGMTNTWQSSNAAEQLFQKMETKDAKSYCAMICGLAKHAKGEEAFQLYETMQSLQLPVNTTTYNYLIRCCSFVRHTSIARWELVNQLLGNMKKENVPPNLQTMNSVLKTINDFGIWKDTRKYALQTLAEMKYLEIEPSLASYYYILRIFCRDNGPTSTILYDIMELLKGKDLTVRDSNDVNFFVQAMEVCHMHVQDYQLAYEVDRLLNHNSNYNLIGDALKESIYYQHFFKLLCQQENLLTFFEVYNRLVPNIYIPEMSVLLEIIKAIGMNSAIEYIPIIWSDILLFDYATKTNVVNEFLKVMAANKPSDLPVCQQWVAIVWDIKNRLEESMSKRSMFAVWTGEMLGNLMRVCLNCGDYNKACEIMKKCDLESQNVSGIISDEHLKSFGEAALANEDANNGLLCAKYMIDVGYMNGSALAKSLLDNLTMSDSIRNSLNEIASMDDSSKNN